MKRIIFKILFVLYKWCNDRLKKRIRSLYRRFDGGEMYSLWLRKIFKDYHRIEIGIGSYGGCFRTENVNENTTIGRYSSIAGNVHIYNRDHPCKYVSTHPIFFNVNCGVIPNENFIEYKKKNIGNDVWIGQNAIILASVRSIGDGAVIGAGAVVTKDVPEYAMVAGVPAKIIGYRFDSSTMDQIKKSKWWDWNVKKLNANVKHFSNPVSFIELLNNEQRGSL